MHELTRIERFVMTLRPWSVLAVQHQIANAVSSLLAEILGVQSVLSF